jgi:O-antigen/teichoic acid export membrane protein
MKREFLANLLFLLFINLVIKPTYLFGVERVVQNVVTENLYGIYFSILNLTLILNIIADFGIQNYNTRYISQHPQLLPKYFSAFLLTKGLLSLVYALVLVLVGVFTGYLWEYPGIMLGMTLCQVLNSMVMYFRSNIAGLSLYWIDSLVSVIDRLVVILFLGIPLWMGYYDGLNFDIQWFVNVQLLGFGTGAVVSFAIVRYHSGPITLRFNWLRMLAIVKAGVPFALSFILMNMYTRVDAPLMERMLVDGREQTNIYASAFRLLEASNVIGYLFAGLLMPMYAKLLKLGQDVKPLAHLGIQIIWSGAISLVVCTIVFRENIMVGLYTTGSAYSGNILGWVIVSFIPVSGVYIFSSLLTAQGSLRQLNRVYVFGVLLNLGLNLWLIPLHKALGAAVANCITQILIFGAQLYLCKRILKVGITWVQAIKFVALAGLALGLASLSKIYLLPELNLWAFLVALAGCGMLAFVLRLISVREVLRILRF